MLRKGRGEPEALSSESELGPAHAVAVSHPLLPLRCHLSWSYGILSFLLDTGGFSPFFTYTRVTSNGRSRSGWLRTFQHVLLLIFGSLILLPACHLLLLLLLLLFLRKCPQNVSETLISRVERVVVLPIPSHHRKEGRWLFSLGAGNVVYHHLLLYVRNRVVSLVGGWN